MFIQAKLKNFRQHTDRTFDFASGLIALRGANEKGKSTLLEAISYALGGTRMLREPLAEVVTWGQKETSLKVWLTFAINGVQYTITRGKSGAEIRTEEKLEATGQDEVTRYVETLLGCSIKTATSLMLANQQKLRGTLEEDGAAVKLIEQLADFQLIDRIVGLVQKHRPCGTTVSVDARIKTLTEQLAQPLEDNTGPYQMLVTDAQQAMDAAGEVYHAKKSVYDSLQEPARQAQQRLAAVETAQRQVVTATQRLAQAKATLDSINPVPGPSEERITELRKQVDDAGRLNRAKLAWAKLQKVPEPAWEGPHADLMAALAAAMKKRGDLQKAMSDNMTESRLLKAGKITQSACGLCGKDLSAVPEVVAKNADIDRQTVALDAAYTQLGVQFHEAEDEAAQYQEVVNDGTRAEQVFTACAEFITIDRNFTPAKWAWTGPDVEAQALDVTGELALALQQVNAYQQNLGRQQEARNAVNAAQCFLNDCVEAEAVALAAVGNAQEVLNAAAEATSELYAVEQDFKAKEQAVKDAERELVTAQRMYQMLKDARALVQSQLEAAQKELVDMEFNNALVDTLRRARPSIVEELWNIVSATVSTEFSAIRGVPSVFMRQDDSFTIDGRSIKGFSGSTLDACGLAIRMGLTKTFLPNTRFLVLDEPAAAADAERETNMLGVIAAGGFDQVILVTHSDLADSFASQVINL